MNMLGGEEDENFHVTRETFFHISDSESEVFGRMSGLMGESAISGMLEFLDREGQHTAINNLLEGQLAVERQKLALLRQQSLNNL